MKVYQFHRVENFLTLEQGEIWESTYNHSLPNSGSDDTPYTRIKLVGESEHPHFLKYFVRHETIKKEKVRIYQEERNEIISVQEFHVYTPKDHSYIWVNARTSICLEMMHRIRSSRTIFSFSTREVKLQDMKESLGMVIRGGWFTALDIADVKAAAIFGDTVSGSDEWQRYESSGKITALNLEMSMNGSLYSLQVGRSGSITTYQGFSERDGLDFVEKINRVIETYSVSYPHTAKLRKGRVKRE